jgi:meso-butanediol dehydrogenase / (S,S)-butanediol dehydrogenase / diacetyl reductase
MTGMAPVDLGDPEAARAWVEEAAALHGRIDVVYNNASAPAYVAMPDASIENWRYTMRNELDLVFYVTKFAWPHLAKRGGVIINTASTSAYVASRAPGALAHCAAKGGVLAMTRAFAADGAAHRIRAVSISPGPIKTPGAIKAFFHMPGAEEATISQLLVDRVGTSEDIAALAAFVASDEAGFITGTDVVIDGGITAL